MPEPPAWLPAIDAASVRGTRARGEDTDRRILDAGRECFRRYGYAAVRIDDIVELAGTSHGSFYLYFRNKEDLFRRLAVECSLRLRELTAALERLPRPLDAQSLEGWVAGFVAMYQQDGPVIRVWLDNRDSDPLMLSLANDALGPLAAALAAIIDPHLASRLDQRMAGLGLLSMLERLSSYLRDDVPEDVATATAARLIFATTVASDPSPGETARWAARG
ncbi:MAG TPA: TetR/AcrR family transcriptional regulator [Mycobacteriales bacterium]|jgi:AcrR family transcriptional regulator|nr:TetR/AcrR family transcriptional regulator [Mycobacteriales bacterium]